MTRIPISRLRRRWMKEPGFRAGYDALEDEFALASMLIDARVKAKLSQQELARRMATSQSTIARLESGAGRPNLSTIARFAKATGMRVKLSLEPAIAPLRRRARRAA